LSSTLDHDSRLGVRGNVKRCKLRSNLTAGQLQGIHLAFSVFSFERHAGEREGGDADRLGHLSRDVRKSLVELFS